MLRRIFAAAFTNIYRHGLLSMTAIVVIAFVIALAHALILATCMKSAAIALVGNQLDLAVDFTKPADTFSAQSIATDLKTAYPTIRDIRFISADEAFTAFTTNFKAVDPTLADWLTQNLGESPLPASLVIAADPSLHQAILDHLAASRAAPMLDLAAAGSSQLAVTTSRTILAIDTIATRIAVGAAVVFAGVAALVIAALLRLTIFARRDEITIMRLVGATAAYVRLPFIIEGVVLTITATLVGTLLAVTALSQLDLAALAGGIFGGAGELIRMAVITYAAHFEIIVGWLILAAMFVGSTAATLATWRYLRRDVVLG